MSEVMRTGTGAAVRLDGRAPIRIVSDGVRTRVLTALGEEIPHVTEVRFEHSTSDLVSEATITVMASVDLTVYGQEFEKEETDADCG